MLTNKKKNYKNAENMRNLNLQKISNVAEEKEEL